MTNLCLCLFSLYYYDWVVGSSSKGFLRTDVFIFYPHIVCDKRKGTDEDEGSQSTDCAIFETFRNMCGDFFCPLTVYELIDS